MLRLQSVERKAAAPKERAVMATNVECADPKPLVFFPSFLWLCAANPEATVRANAGACIHAKFYG